MKKKQKKRLSHLAIMSFVALVTSAMGSSANATSIIANDCMIGGCSRQLCLEASTPDGMASTCEYRAEYACYQKAECKRQDDGKCGWTQTDGLKLCLAHPPGNAPATQ